MSKKKLTNSGYILFSEGQYSDYQNTAYAVLKPFKLQEVTLLFMDQWKPQYGGQTKPDTYEFIHWMNINGYIRDTPEVPEIHLGGYNFEPDKIGLGLMRHEFTPPPAQQPAPAMEPCKGCNGAGEVETGIGMMTCDECHGTGVQPRKAVKLTDYQISCIAVDNPPDVHVYARAIEQAVWAKLGVSE